MIFRARDYPDGGLEKLRPKIHDSFIKNKDERDPEKILNGIKHAQFVLKELEALIYLKKYRTIQKRYSKETQNEIIVKPVEFGK